MIDRRGFVLGCLGAASACSPALSGRPSAAPPASGAPGASLALVPSSPFHDVRAYGAVADGRTKCTEAVARAIAAAAEAGGGTVLFPAGQYLTGPIHLKSNITLFIDAGAVVKFSQDFDDYLPMVRMRWEGTEVTNFSPLIYADGVENIAIHGRGVLDGQGEPWWQYYRALRDEFKKTGKWRTDSRWQKEFARLNQNVELPDDPKPLQMAFLRPSFIQFLSSKNVSVRDVTLRRSPFWTVNPVYCDDVTVAGITIENPDDAPNTDGINPDSCRNVHISDCHINVGDDCITIKSGRDRQGRRIGRPAENHTITNCTMLHGHGGVVIGSEMSGGVRKIAISNCIFDGTDRGIRIKSTRGRGAVVEDVRVSNVVMKAIREEAITLNLFYAEGPAEPLSERTPRFRRIHVSGITGEANTAGLLLGLPESPLEDVSFTDLHLTANKGFLVQDARDVRLDSVRIDTVTGPAVRLERVENLDLSGVVTGTPHADAPTVALVDVKNAYVHDCFALRETQVFLEVGGAASEAIVVEGGDLLRAKTPLVKKSEVRAAAVVVRGSSK